MQPSEYSTVVRALTGLPELRRVRALAEWRVEPVLNARGLVVSMDFERGRGCSVALCAEDAQDLAAVLADAASSAAAGNPSHTRIEGTANRVAEQALRREAAEQSLAGAQAEAARLQEELAHLHQHVKVLNGELGMAESYLREMNLTAGAVAPSLKALLSGRRLLYVGGRPSSTPAIRGLVLRHGGVFQPHDGTASEDDERLARAIACADLVAVPLDGIDHDSAAYVSCLCGQHGVPYVPLRQATVAGFAAAMASLGDSRSAADARTRQPAMARPLPPY